MKASNVERAFQIKYGMYWTSAETKASLFSDELFSSSFIFLLSAHTARLFLLSSYTWHLRFLFFHSKVTYPLRNVCVRPPTPDSSRTGRSLELLTLSPDHLGRLHFHFYPCATHCRYMDSPNVLC